MAPTVLKAVALPTLVRGGFALMGTLILSSWLVCAFYEDECPIFLPTISDTWVYPPTNYISRWLVGNLAILFAMFQLCIYFANVAAPAPAKPPPLSYGALCGMAIFGVFCFSWVGAICDNADAPSCRGNNTLHTTLAVTFFALYDVYMVFLNHFGPFPASARRIAAVAGSLLSKGRWVVPVLKQLGWLGATCCHDNTWLAMVEWFDVSCIIYWTTSYATDPAAAGPFIASLSWGGVVDEDACKQSPSSSSSSSSSVLWAIPCRSMMKIVCGMYVGVLGGCVLAALTNGVLPHSPNRVPYISDLFVYPPGNWISRWGIVEACHWLAFVQTFVCYASESASSSGRSSWFFFSSARARTALVLAAVFGLSVVGVCNEDENIHVHRFGAYLWFGGYDLYMLLTTFEPLNHGADEVPSRRRRGVGAMLFSAAACLQIVRYGPAVGLFALPAAGANIAPILEWSNALVMMAFALTDVYGRPATAQCAGAIIMSSDAFEEAVSVSELTAALI